MINWTLEDMNSNIIEDLKDNEEINIPCYKEEYENYIDFLEDLKGDIEYPGGEKNYEFDYEFYPDQEFENQGELILSCYEIIEDTEDEEEEEEKEEDITIKIEDWKKIKNVLVSCWEVNQEYFYENDEGDFEEINKIMKNLLYENKKT